jgi:eukaryotic-like serine/threonine-protein kinase
MASRSLRPGDPRRLGDYQLLARLGEGGMGTVFLGRDPAGQLVAVKAIKPEYAGNEEFRARFRSEVSRARAVPSFCTAAVLAADPDSATPYLVVEYVDGPSLQEMVHERGPMAPGDLHSVAVGVAAALTAIHGAGVIHRDLKPANVLLSLGLPKVIDFGIARALEGTTQHTRPGRFVGTVDYMAPERLDSSFGPVTAAADIFAWGAVIVFAGTGRIPFEGASPMATAAQILTRPPHLQGLPSSLTELVASALDKDPRNRPTANELLQGLLLVETPKLLTVDTPSPIPADVPNAPHRRFDARDLLEQIIAERPAPSPHKVAPVSRSVDRQLRNVRRSKTTYAGSGTTRTLLYALAAVLVTSLLGVTLAYARTTGHDQPAATPTTALRPEAAAAPSSKVYGPSFADPLRAPGRFQESVGEAGRCTFQDEHLRAQVNGRSTYQCPGPADTFSGDQSIAVNVTLASEDACAMVWFRYRGTRGYQLTACANQLELEELNEAVLTSIGRTSATPMEPGTPHDLSIVIAGGHATVFVDEKPSVQATVADPDLTSGRIQLGLTNTSHTRNAEVQFANLEVRAS